jgi:hypothetical protein
MDNAKLTEIFGRFVGREVALIEKPYEAKGRSGTYLVLPDNDSTLTSLKAVAGEHGLDMRVCFPGGPNADDMMDPERLNVTLLQDQAGAWRVAPRFNIG